MSFRAATLEDEAFFYYWRRYAEARGAAGGWYLGARTTREEHQRWFTDKLLHAVMLVWEREGEALGTARIDSNGEVAFSAEPADAPALLRDLQPFAAEYGGRLKVTVDEADRAAIAALTEAGWGEFPVRFFCYRP